MHCVAELFLRIRLNRPTEKGAQTRPSQQTEAKQPEKRQLTRAVKADCTQTISWYKRMLPEHPVTCVSENLPKKCFRSTLMKLSF